MKFNLFSIVILLSFSFGICSRILVLVPFPGQSHWFMIQNIINGLLEKGHEVTTITSMVLQNTNTEQLKNYTHVAIDPEIDLDKMIPQSTIFESTDAKHFMKMYSAWRVTIATSRYGFENPNVQKFIHDETQKFDLVISELFYQDSWNMFAYRFNAPLAIVSTFGRNEFVDRSMGIWMPWSFVPQSILDFSDEMTFLQRCQNVICSAFDILGHKFYVTPFHEEIARQNFGFLEKDGEKLPSLNEIAQNTSLFLINSHISYDHPRPIMPGQIDIAGINLAKPIKPLPADIKKFLDEAEHGVIYFSWGTVVKSSELPEEKLQIFLNTFKGLKQRILWKWEKDDAPGFPSNIMTKKWMPQNDILAHPNVILFISHGGLFGSQEGLYRGVPMLFTPFFGDQRRNSRKAVRAGYAETIPFVDITEENLINTLNKMLTNKKYSNRVKELSAIFRDRIVDPLDEAIYWIEYVIRHKGAMHLKSNAAKLNWIQYHLFDVYAFFLLTVVGGLLLLVKIFKLLHGNKKSDKLDTFKKAKNQ